MAARAVEVLHNYGEHRLRVLFATGESPEKFVRVEPPIGLLRGEGDVLTTEDVRFDAYDVRARREGGDWLLERPSKEAHEALTTRAPAGVLALARIKDDRNAADRLRSALVAEWRYQFLARRLKKTDREGALDIEVRLWP